MVALMRKTERPAPASGYPPGAPSARQARCYADGPAFGGCWALPASAGEIEPHDDAAAATCHVSEAYSITTPVVVLEPANAWKEAG